ncbi:MAG: hypothetical protein R3359_11945 [Marinirhabdus sp.]|nr:hypothetical protein [Marinirhabdus sp.]
MLSKTNLETQLRHQRDKRTYEDTLMEEVYSIFSQNQKERDGILTRINSAGPAEHNNFILDKLESEHIFHLEDIKELCITYRLRFVAAHRFKKEIPEEAISKIRNLEKQHDTQCNGFKIVAPAKLLKLDNADDPLLFVPIGNDYYYLIHKWGNDLHPLRRWLMWPYKNFENLIFAIFVVSILLTAITPMGAFTKGEVTNQEYLLMFLFMFKAVGGIVLFYGFAKGKNFNNAIWNSNYYNA